MNQQPHVNPPPVGLPPAIYEAAVANGEIVSSKTQWVLGELTRELNDQKFLVAAILLIASGIASHQAMLTVQPPGADAETKQKKLDEANARIRVELACSARIKAGIERFGEQPVESAARALYESLRELKAKAGDDLSVFAAWDDGRTHQATRDQYLWSAVVLFEAQQATAAP